MGTKDVLHLIMAMTMNKGDKMKQIILFIVAYCLIGFAGNVQAEEYACTPENNCGGLSQEQEDCVVKKRCNAEIRKLLKKIKDLEEENEELQLKNAMLESERNLEGLIREHVKSRETDPKRNSISLLAGRVGTGIKVEESSGRYRAKSEVENDLGLMYQRDFGETQRYRGSLGLTLRGAGYLGIGLNF